QEPPLPLAAPRAKVVTLDAAPPGTEMRLSTQASSAVAAEPLGLAVNKSIDIRIPGEVREVVLGNPDVADVVVRSPSQIYVSGRAVGQTNLFLLDRAGRTLRRYEIDVHLDSDAVAEAVRRVLPAETRLQVTAVADSIFLSGTVSSDVAAATAKALARRYVADDTKVVNVLKVGTEQQVLLHVKVAEMQKTVLKELGVNASLSDWQGAGMKGTLATSGISSTLGGLTGLSSSSLFGTVTVSGINSLTASLSALERQGLIRTLVEPNLTAVSGETAQLLAGGEYPIPVSQSSGQVTVEYKQFGVLLSFTPVVIDAGRISLKMATEVSAIDSSVSTAVSSTLSVNGLKVRRASSTVELPSGGSLMIAGLLQNDITSTLSGMPGIMDVPILGALFRSNTFKRSETEMVVILTAYAVEPLDRPGLSLPSDGFAPSSDIDRNLMGRLQDTYTKMRDPPLPPPRLQGPVGYIMH
ncbi:MAG: type II and III secretion system protein family protein, partial [Magnetospirillum sp.]